MDFDSDQSLKEWAKDKPLSILQLDPADRAVLRIADERDAIQKKTFTKWVNKHLKKANRHVNDLFIDLQDGLNLISLLEVLSGEHLPRERGKMRFHMLQNVQMALDFLRFKKIKLVNIRAEDIVDGNPKLTLGLIWTIILHFQISDIVVGQEPNVSAKDALLRWARRSTAKYPGVRVNDFTASWRDGLAFNALIHRNRPDLIDWRNIRSRAVRERLETAFHVAEREYGVTRLLDPEDVDTHEIDEKSIITYISSLYDVFPEPPPIHPLYDSESQTRVSEYRELSSSLHLWMREKQSMMSDRNFPNTLIEMKKLASESNRFRTDEIPARQRDKNRIHQLYRELQRYFEAVGEVDIEPELQVDNIERNWNRMMMAHTERDRAIQDELKRLERLQRLAEKVHREMKRVDSRLEDIESRISEEARRLDRLHPLDAKHNVDILEQELRSTEENIQTLFSDVTALREGHYPQANDLHKRVQKLHQRWVSLRSLLHSKLITPLSSLSFPIVEERTVTRQTRTVLETRLVDTNTHFRQLNDCIEWCRSKLKQLQESEYGSDLPGVQAELELHQREHKSIEQFHTRVEHCINAKNNFQGDELTLYSQHLTVLQKTYAELLSCSSKRLTDLETLQDFLQSATNQLVWLNEKEEVEVTRDWSNRDVNIPSLEQYYENLMSELEKREIQLSAVQDRGEALLLQHHPAAKCIEAYIAAMQTQWAWLLQLTLCLETHLKHSAHHQHFYRDVREVENWLNKKDELLNSVYSQSEFSLDEGEHLLKGMQELREELNAQSDVLTSLAERAQSVVPLKQRRQPVTRPIPVLAVCSYNQGSVRIEKGEQWVLHDNSGRVKWRVSNGANGSDSNVPGVVFLIPPPDKEALDAIERLKRQFERSLALWQRKQLRMRQNMIFATIRVVRSWDLAQFLAMGADQRNAIRKALNEDATKLLNEGDPADPQLRRLKREMDEVNRLFDDFERRARAEEESKNAGRIFTEQVSSLQTMLDEAERTLNTRLASPLPRDMDSLEHLVIQHKDYETTLKGLTPDVDAVQSTFRSIARKTPQQESKLDKVLSQWNQIWNNSHLYVERLKCVEMLLSSLEEANSVLSDFELKLVSYGEMPSQLDQLQQMHEELLALQKAVSHQQPAIDQLLDDASNTRKLVERSRQHLPHLGPYADLERLDTDIHRFTQRWNNICKQLSDRLRSCESAYNNLQKFTNSYQTEVSFVDSSYGKLNNLTPVKSHAKEQIEPTKALFNSVIERSSVIETVNLDGGRFIREAKIYALQLERYREWLIDEVHPSLDATSMKRPRLVAGEAIVARDLDILNHRFQALIDILLDRLKQLINLYPQHSDLQEFVSRMDIKPLRTFRTEFNIYDQGTADDDLPIRHSSQSRLSSNDLAVCGDTVDDSQLTKSVATVRVTRGSSKEKVVIVSNSDPCVESDKMGSVSSSRVNGEAITSAGGTTMQFSEIRSLRRVQRVEEGIGTEMIVDTAGIVHPQTGEVLTVGDAIRLRVLDVRTGRINTIVEAKTVSLTIREAVSKGLVDPNLAERLLGPSGIIQDEGDGRKQQISLLEAIQRELYDAEHGPIERAKQAMEEKYRLCDDILSQLLAWIGEVEDRIANQDVAQEDPDQLKNQISILKLLKEEVDSQSRQVSSCLEQVRVVVTTGSEYLSRDEVLTLEKNGKSLRTRYDRAVDRTDKLLRRLTAAKEELNKFKSEMNMFVSWLDKARRALEERERNLASLNKLDASGDSTREFVSDVIAHQADLRFITMAAQKFFDESKEYLTCLNDFRTSLPARLPHIEPISSQESEIRNNVANVSAQYRDLLNRANNLADKLSGVGGRQRDYRDALDKARAWMRDAEPRANKALSEPVAADPNTLEEQLQRVKALNNEFVAQGRLIDNAKMAMESLVHAVEGQVSAAELAALQEPVQDLENKYIQLSEAIAERCKQLDTALVQSQGVQDALDSLLTWLSSAENRLKDMTRPISLQKDRLEDRLREYRVLQSDIDSHRPSVDSVSSMAQELIATASNPRLAKKIETKLKDVINRMDKVQERCMRLGDQLSEVHLALTQFSSDADQLERWLGEVTEAVADATPSLLEELVVQRDARRDRLEAVVRDGKALVNKKDVTDTGHVRDRIKGLETQWKELNTLLDEKLRLGKARTEQQLAYERLRDQVQVWLANIEGRVGRLEPVAIDIDVIKRQADELKPLLKEHRDYAVTIDKLNDLGHALDSLARPDSPTRRRSSVSPVKRSSVTTSPLRRTSHDGSPSPTKMSSVGFSLQSPVSPGGSSGFGSRRSSQENFHLEDLSPVQQELSEINNRYSLVGVRLGDRQSEIDAVREEVRRHAEHLRQLSQFLDKVQRALPRETIPQSKDEADKLGKLIKGIQEEMYEKQSLLESTRSGISDLLRRKPGVAGADHLHDEMQDVVSRWRSLQDTCKNRIALMEDLKDFHDTHDSLSNWLSAKDRMMTVLGPISSDSRMVQSQVQQVQVMREEFRTQQPQLQHLSDITSSVLSRVPSDCTDTNKISSKLQSIQDRWADLLARLDERLASLGAAADTTREFDSALTRLRDTLQGISDQLDDVPLDREPEEQLRKVQMLERQLEGARPLLADLESAGHDLCEVLSDPASRAEIQAKLAAVNRQYNTLQKKLDLKKAEIEGSLRDGRQFEATCAKTLGWLSEQLGALSERLLVSADREVLQQQLDMHEPVYKEVLQKEHEVIMLLNKGRELLGRTANRDPQRADTRSLQRDIDKIQQQWERLRKDVADRHTRLQTCMEHCRKYYRVLEGFIPWLSQAENRLDALKPDSFKRRDVERQLRELSAFRNDVWKRSGEFENLRSLGETFLAACDVDKEIVKQELAAIKTRWDKLNNELLERTQWLEEMSRRLADFTDQLRDLSHSVQRCEDKLASHDTISNAARDPKMLERIKALKEETIGLKKPLATLRQTANDLVAEAAEVGVNDASHLRDDVDNLSERLDDLQSRLDDRLSQLQSATTAVSQFNEQVKSLVVDLTDLEKELDAMKAPGRDLKTVRSQQDDLAKLQGKIVRAADDVNKAVVAGERLVDSGFAPDTAATRDQVDSLARQLGRLEERAHTREDELESILNRLHDFCEGHQHVLDDITQASEDLRRLKPVGSEVEVIKAQQDEFAQFRQAVVEPLSHSVDDLNRVGQGLIQSAAGGVNTTVLEKDLEKMNDRWNTLKDKLNERDRRLDIGLLQSGKFQEALEGFAKWLSDTEEMVANQKPPSADYKVVKAQLQEQKFLKKMLMDRQQSMSSLFAMGKEVAAGADPTERKAVERQLKELTARFDNLCEGAAQRMDALQQAMAVAKDFQDKLIPVVEWLDKTEKKIKDMELVPTDEEKIQQRIREHDALHNEILRKKSDLSDLTEVGSNLMALVGEEEAAVTADKVQDTADRYAALVDMSDAVGQLLEASRAGLRHLVLTYQDLQAWMESMENRLSKYKVLAVHTDKLLEQMEDLADLTEEVSNHQGDVDGTVDSGLELMKHISSDEALQLKDKLDSLQRRYNDLTTRCSDLLKHAQEALPLVQQFHNAHNRLVDWMLAAETQLQVAEPSEDDIQRLEHDIQEFRPVLETVNLIGPQLCQISPGEGASTIEGLVMRDNRRFDAIAEQIQRKAERLHLSKQRSLEVIGDIDDLLEWFREVESQLREAEPPSSEPDVIRVQLKEHKALNDDISSQKGRVRDVLSTAKKVLRESTQHPNDDSAMIREKMEDLRDTMETVSGLSIDRLGVLEQALPLAEHFQETHTGLSSWLDDMEQHVRLLALPALRPDLIAQQQDKNEMLIQSLGEQKPLVEKLNKTGEALIKLCNDEEGAKVQDILDSDNARYSALRAELRQRQQALEKALQESSQFSDKLEGMLRALTHTADQVSSVEPVSAHPSRIRDQMEENAVLVEDLDKREEAFQAVKKAANDVINKAPNAADPAVKDIKRKLERLNSLWNEVQQATSDRSRSLEEALAIAEKFWEELQAVMATLRDLQDSLQAQEPPAVRPHAIQQQQHALQEIKAEMDQTKPEVEQCRQTGQSLMKICGEPDKPEVKKHMEDLDTAWDNITALFAKREENLIHAMEKAMEFHETLQDLLDFLDQAEEKFANLGPLGSDIDAVKRQINQLKAFKAEVDPHMVKVEALNRQAQELTERTSAEQAAALKEPLTSVNQRWDELLRGVVERQRQLENALLRLGQFQHALSELMAWIDATERTLDRDLRPVAGDPQLLEVELAKLKVLVNDIQAHQSSVDTLNDAGRQIIESGKGSDEASSTQDKLTTLNRRWRELLQKAADRQSELEEALRDAHRFAAEIQDLLSWLGEVDGVIAASKPVGGLPETASEQLERFMEVYNELEENRPKVETVLQQGQEYLNKSAPGTATNLQTNLRTLKQRWDSVTARANDKKIKLEIALKEATEFHDALQAFVDWLTGAEKTLANLKPVSRVLATILEQIEEHKAFQKDVGVHRETMLHLDKKGTHLKYFSQKQDVILIKNLLISVQHRWERVVSKSAERTRALDHGYKEAREFHDAWSNLMNWLNETEKSLDELAAEASSIGNDPERIKARLAKHREFQRALSGKQATYDATMRAGKTLKEKAPKTDEPQLRQMMTDLKEKWNSVCAKSVDRQRKLEEALLYCGQFKDALEALLDWLKKTEKELSEDTPVHGDLDTVMALVEQHKTLEEDLQNRSAQMESVQTTGKELIEKASKSDAQTIRNQLGELNSLWTRTNKLAERKTQRLEEALKVAETLHKRVHMLLEWLSDAEMKLRFVNSLPDDEQETRNQLAEHAKFMREMVEKEVEKDATITLAQQILAKAHPDATTVIKHWITIIQARWDEVSTWAKQREQRLQEHLRSLQDLDTLLEELLAWLAGLESTLTTLEAEPLPDDILTLEALIADHQEFMENTARRQPEVDSVLKARQQPVQPAKSEPQRRGSGKKLSAASKDELSESTTDLHDSARKASLKASRDNLGPQDRRGSRASPVREMKPADGLPHYGPRFPPKGSKGSEPVFRNPRCRLLWDRWRHVWLLAWERQRRLQERLTYLQELEKVKNFSWDQWRKRFLKFMNHKKSRLTDLFRKMDKNNDGLIPRDDFVDGIIKTKFDTSKLEMSAVADMFDHNGEGLIDWKEFIAALRPDWEEKRPTTEAEKIHDEVKRLVMLCTCRQKFRVFQVGEGKYRFGDSQKLRLVRILRSTVMVRVGGGWVALDEFLVKNDPCRAEEFLSVLMPIFENLRQRESLPCSYPLAMGARQPGPLTCHPVRERSARSVPMGKAVTGRTSGTPDSLSDNEGSPLYTRTPTRKGSSSASLSARRSSLTPGGSLPGSRPSSRQGSKPPSRHGSNLSLASSDDGTPSRIPRRSVPASRSSGTTTPTSGARKLTVPAMNGSTNRTRSPSGVRNTSIGGRTSSSSSSTNIHRASSIPTLSGVGSSRSRIPVYIGLTNSESSSHYYYPPSHSASSSSGWTSGIPTTPSSNIPRLIRTRTPSGSSTPVPAGMSTTSSKLVRKPSTASESASRKQSPTDSKTTPAPFRL
ncbi:dystonin-like protein short stop isoform X29 [Lycorma delicatula]|uniref:dystonin-like protein short stop isoform X29 n=1 Tax=Lycorma delicatula TaxID=130591 RepID=UPI003F515935